MLRRRFLNLSAALAACLWLAAPIAPAMAATPEAFIGDVTGQALKTLMDPSSQAEKEQRFQKLLAQSFDLPRISRFVLGRYWNAASDQEKQEFQSLFETYIIRAYSNRFGDYAGETVKVIGSRPQNNADSVVMSQIILPQGGPPVKVDWVVAKNGDAYRITDISVEGVSMVLTQKQEFAAVIERNGGGVAGLIKQIREKLQVQTTAQK